MKQIHSYVFLTNWFNEKTNTHKNNNTSVVLKKKQYTVF